MGTGTADFAAPVIHIKFLFDKLVLRKTLFYTFDNERKRGGFAYVSVKTCGESCSGTVLADGDSHLDYRAHYV